MKKLTSNKVAKSVALLCGSVLSNVALSAILGDKELAKQLSEHLGIGAFCLLQTVDIAKGFTSDFIKHWLQEARNAIEFDKNHDLELVWSSAYEQSIKKIKKQLFAELDLDSSLSRNLKTLLNGYGGDSAQTDHLIPI